MHGYSGLGGEVAEFRCELHFSPPFARRVKDGPAFHRTMKHFFEADGLGTKLDIIIVKLPSLTLFELDGNEQSIWMLFDNIAFPAEPQSIRPDRERPEQLDALGKFVTGKICVLVDDVSLKCMLVIHEDSFNVNQRRPSIAIQELVERGERNDVTLSARRIDLEIQRTQPCVGPKLLPS